MIIYFKLPTLLDCAGLLLKLYTVAARSMVHVQTKCQTLLSHIFMLHVWWRVSKYMFMITHQEVMLSVLIYTSHHMMCVIKWFEHSCYIIYHYYILYYHFLVSQD